MNKYTNEKQKILIVYATQFGSTQGVAEAVGDVFRAKGNKVDISWVKEAPNVNAYDAIIVGSAIQYDKWMQDAAEFVQENQDALNKIPVAYFFTCLTLSKRNEDTERKAMVYADKIKTLAPQVKPVGIGRFAGALDYNKFSFLSRIFAKGMFFFLRVPEGDYREWRLIRSWANEMHMKLTHQQEAVMVAAYS